MAKHRLRWERISAKGKRHFIFVSGVELLLFVELITIIHRLVWDNKLPYTFLTNEFLTIEDKLELVSLSLVGWLFFFAVGCYMGAVEWKDLKKEHEKSSDMRPPQGKDLRS